MGEISINYWAVIAAAIANIAIGALWYGPVFGKYWKKLMGFTDDTMKAMPLRAWQAVVGGLVNSLVIAYVLLFFTVTWVAPTFGGALMAAFWIWLGFVATTQISSYLWEGKPLKLFLLNTVCSFLSYLVMASILVLWQ